ncbi:hypothetical protein FJZ36_08515 [Candidatus Poribacteria bacterium]|nr:hypothetical protein [Candidatus Poribacteria bacterium]
MTQTIAAVALPAMALSLGWGIRGQYGGRHGAMVAGALVGLALAWITESSGAWGIACIAAVAMSAGGVMTYGQTIGLTQNPDSVGLYWKGMFGLALKGSAWIGSAALWMGIASGYARYDLHELVGLGIGQFLVGLAGVGLLNRPHDPPKRLPRIYFSNANDLRPRVEWWGGMWSGLLLLAFYVGVVKRDLFALGMGAFGMAGGFGFPLGQSIQAWAQHRSQAGRPVGRWVDWWKVMELTFGASAGAAIGLGWLLLTARGFETGRHPLPSVPTWGFVALASVYAAVYIASLLRVTPLNVGLSAPYAEAMLLLPLVAGAHAPPFLLGLVLSSIASIRNARRFYADGIVRARLASAIAVSGTILGAGLGWVVCRDDLTRWFLFVVWFQTLSTVTWSGMRALVNPDRDSDAQRGRLRATVRTWGTGLPVECVLVALAAAVTLWVVAVQ